MSTRELGIAPLSALNTSPEDFIYQAQEVGFDFVGLRVIPVTPQEPQYDLSEGTELFHKVIKALDRTGLYVKDAEFILLDGTDQRDQWMTALERAALFGAHTLTVAVGMTDLTKAKDIVAEMVEAGKDFHVTPAIEPISYQGVRDLDAVEEIAKTGSLFLPDTLHLHRFGATPQQLGAVTAYIPMIQICGAEPQRPANREGLVEESRGHRLAPNAGASDVVGYLRAVSPDVPVSVETPNDIFVGHYGSRAWLEKLYQAGREVIASA